MKNLSSYCGLVDPKIRSSDKDLPVRYGDELNEQGSVMSTTILEYSNKSNMCVTKQKWLGPHICRAVTATMTKLP